MDAKSIVVHDEVPLRRGRARLEVSGGIVTTMLAILIAGVGWLFPLVSFGAAGLKLTGVHDESTGFLYFYALRRLYGVDEHPWLPSSQVPGLVHLGIQFVLTAVGYPPTDLHPRIDIASYMAPAVPLVAAVLLLAWAVQPIRSGLARILVAAVFVGLTYETALYIDYELTSPGYHPWAHPVSALMLGWLLRATRRELPSTLALVVLVGGFAGVCLSIKPSYVPYPATIGLLLLLRQSTMLRATLLVVGSAVLATVTYLALTWAAFAGHLPLVLQHLQITPVFIRTEMSGVPLGTWTVNYIGSALRSLPAGLADPRLWAIAAPILFGIGLALPAGRRLSSALLLGSAMYLASLDRRPSEATQIEVFGLLAASIPAWTSVVLWPWLASLANRGLVGQSTLFAGKRAVLLGLLLLTATWIGVGISRFEAKVRPAFQAATEGERRLQQFVSEAPGRTLFAFIDYSHRPITVDAAIHRGGISLGESWVWRSDLVRSMLPSRMYVLGIEEGSAPQRINMARYRKLIYTYDPKVEDDESALVMLERQFGIRTNGYTCDFEYRFWDSYQPGVTLSNVVVARGCTRTRSR